MYSLLGTPILFNTLNLLKFKSYSNISIEDDAPNLSQSTPIVLNILGGAGFALLYIYITGGSSPFSCRAFF